MDIEGSESGSGRTRTGEAVKSQILSRAPLVLSGPRGPVTNVTTADWVTVEAGSETPTVGHHPPDKDAVGRRSDRDLHCPSVQHVKVRDPGPL